VIYGGDGDGVRLDEARGVAVTNLMIIGSGPKTNRKGSGVLVRQASDVTVDGIEASGFQHAGVFVEASLDVRVTRVYAHDNGFAGILAGYFYNVKARPEPSRNVYIGYCQALNNPGNPNPAAALAAAGSASGTLTAESSSIAKRPITAGMLNTRARREPVPVPWASGWRSAGMLSFSIARRTTTGARRETVAGLISTAGAVTV